MRKYEPSVFVLLGLAFLEGSVIMLLQLSAGSLLGPYFGNSLQTWAILIGVVFTAFATGYYSAHFHQAENIAFLLMAAGAYLVLILPLASGLPALLDIGPVAGVLAAASALVLVPVALLSAVPVLVTATLAKKFLKSGFSNGLTFFISTTGGIAASFLTGFYLIPNYGPAPLIRWTGIVLFALGLPAALSRGTAALRAMLFVIVPAVVITLFLDRSPQSHPASKKILHVSSGMLGQLIVADDTADNSRTLYINGSAQAQASLADLSSSYAYVQHLVKNTSYITLGKRVLILGMGGGYLANYYAKKGAAVDLVELDKRIPALAEQFFLPDGLKAKVYIDDARHFINKAVHDRKYDLIVVDVYTGDNAPFHIITRESFGCMRELLNANGRLCVYFPFSLDPDIMLAHARMRLTLHASGFATYDEGTNANGRVLVYAKPSNRHPAEPGQEMFSDNKPQLELLLRHQHRVMNSLRKRLWKKAD